MPIQLHKLGSRGLRGLLVAFALTGAALHGQAVLWDNGSGNSAWGTASNWNPNGVPSSTAALTFDDTYVTSNQTISLGANRQAGSLAFGGPYTYTFNSSSNSLQLNSSGTNFTQNSSAALTFNNTFTLATDLTMAGTGTGAVSFKSVLSGAGGLTMNGSYGVTLNAANTYSGATTVNGGTLTFGVNNALPTATALTIGSGATVDVGWGHSVTVGSLSGSGTFDIKGNTLNVGDSTNTTFSGVLTDSGGYGKLVKNGTGILTLSGNNTFAGPVTINAGAIVAASNTAFGSSTWGNTVNSGAALELSGGITMNEGSFTINGSGLSGGGALRSVSGANTFAGTLNLGSASTFGADAGASLTVSGALSLSYAIGTAGSGDVILSGQIYGSNGITKNGTGTLTISGTSANSFSGALQINDGTVVMSKSGSGNYAMGGGSAIVGDGIGSAGSAVLTMTADNQIPNYAPAVTVNSDGNLDIANTAQSLNIVNSTGEVTVGSSGTLTLGVNSGSSTLGGNILGNGTIVKSGSGTVTINGSSANSFTGSLQVSNGTVSMSKSGTGNYAMSGGSVTVGTGTGTAATLAMGADNQLAPSIAVSVMSDGTLNVGSTTQNLDALSSAGTVTVASSGNLVLGASGGSSTLGGTLTGAGTLTLSSGSATINGTTSNTFNGSLQVNSGTVTLSKSGTGIYAMNGGSVTLGTGSGSAGAAVLAMGADNQLAPSTTVSVQSDGNFNVGSTAQSLNVVNSSGLITLGSTGNLTLGASGGSSTLGGTITGSGTITKSGTGTVTINGSSGNSFNGSLQVSAGTVSMSKSGSGNYAMNGGSVTVGTGTGTSATLSMGADNQLASSTAVNVMSDGTFSVGSTTQSLNAISNAGSVSVGPSGNLILGTSGGSSTLGGALSGSGSLTLSSGSATINGSSSNTFSGSLQVNSGTVTLSKSGGTYAMSGGSVTLGTGSGGSGAAVLAMGANNQLTPSTAVTVLSDGNLNIGSTTQSIDSVTSSGIVTVASSGTLNLGTSGGNSTLGGTLSGSGAIVKQGSGTLSFNSTLNFSGTLTLASGTLALGSSSLTLGTLHITGNSTIDFGGSSGSLLNVSNFIVDSGVTLSITNWVDTVDHFYVTNWSGGTLDIMGVAPMNQVGFNGYSGNDTVWTSFTAYPEVRLNVPEPSTYGAIFSLLSLGALYFVRRRQRRAP